MVKATQSRNRQRRPRDLWLAGAAFVVVLVSAAVYQLSDHRSTQQQGIGPAAPRFEATRAEAVRFLEDNRTIQLTTAQTRVYREALSALAAPCCSQYTMATCCCPCNLAKSVWGLSKGLIARTGAGVAEVRAAAMAWTRALNASGYAGDACFKGRCNQSMAGDACGGMDEEDLIM